MINITNLSIQYSGNYLFENISFGITPRDRIGLVGKNGAGKSTILKVLKGDIKGEVGTVITMDNNETIGYLPQELQLNPTQSVYNETLAAFNNIKHLENEIDSLNYEVENASDYESEGYFKILHKLADSQELYKQLGGYTMREDIEKVLKGLGFKSSDLDRPLREFSGGYQMRVELAKILLQRPTYVLLDEPTNHLDIEAIMWLENFLSQYAGGVVLISHDRAFLDRIVTRIVELVNAKLYDFKGVNYSQYVELRDQRRERQQAEAKQQEKYIEHTQELINKFRAKKNKAAFAQTLITKLDKIEKVEIDDVENAAIKFKFPDPPRSAKIVVRTQDLSKNYDDYQVLKNIDFELERGEKIAFVGKNGEGKTTLGKIITNSTNYQSGVCEVGQGVSIGYFEQNQAESLDPKKTVFQTLDDVATGENRLKIRNLLGMFLFSGEASEKKVSVLSGGEKARLALALLLLSPSNLLILDEPTNHLDMRAKDMLKNALLAYQGSVIVVSHDREFLKDLTSKVYEFKDKQIKMHIGDIYNFLENRNIETLDELNFKKSVLNPTAMPAFNTNTAPQIDEKELKNQKREVEKNIKTQANKVNKAEKKIAELEIALAKLEIQMADSEFYTLSNHKNILEQYAAQKKELDTEMESWETYSSELEVLQNQLQKFEL